MSKHQKFKKSCADLLGGECAICGRTVTYDNLHTFEFHHLNPNLKQFTFGSHRWRREDIIHEITTKCILVCDYPCHKELTKMTNRCLRVANKRKQQKLKEII